MKITEYSQWYKKNTKDQSWKPLKLIQGKEQGKNVIAQLDGVNYRDEAEALVGTEIAIHKDQLEVLAENEYFFVAQSYEWSDDRAFKLALTFTNDFTGEKDIGFNQNFYGNDIFGKKWRTIHTAAVEALAPAEYKQFVTHKETTNLL